MVIRGRFAVTVESLPGVSEPPTLPGSLPQRGHTIARCHPRPRRVPQWNGEGGPWPQSNRVSLARHLPLFLVTASCIPPGLWQKWFLEVSLVERLLHLPS